MDKALAGAAVLNYKDQDYGFSTVENNEKVPCEVLVPQKNGYKARTYTFYKWPAGQADTSQSPRE